MKKYIHFLIVLIAGTYSLFGQHKVRGIVVDSQGKPLEYVNVVAMQQPVLASYLDVQLMLWGALGLITCLLNVISGSVL